MTKEEIIEAIDKLYSNIDKWSSFTVDSILEYNEEDVKKARVIGDTLLLQTQQLLSVLKDYIIDNKV
jgi:hypothetical protein